MYRSCGSHASVTGRGYTHTTGPPRPGPSRASHFPLPPKRAVTIEIVGPDGDTPAPYETEGAACPRRADRGRLVGRAGRALPLQTLSCAHGPAFWLRPASVPLELAQTLARAPQL